MVELAIGLTGACAIWLGDLLRFGVGLLVKAVRG